MQQIIEPLLHFLMPGLSSQQVTLLHGFIRKCGHIIEYFILGILLFSYFRGGSNESRAWRWALYSTLVVLLYAVSDEIHQSFVLSRTASAADAVLDASGGTIAQLVSVIRHKHRLG
ncbi:MAG: VanZ family protein [Nitrospirae bacterium]|nr:VanZ family protein [Nitrospirota bacterium]